MPPEARASLLHELWPRTILSGVQNFVIAIGKPTATLPLVAASLILGQVWSYHVGSK